MIERWLVVTAVIGILLWLVPGIVYVAALILSFKLQMHIGLVPVGPLAVSVLAYVFAVWRWPFGRCPACRSRRRGANYGSTRSWWGRCPLRCRGGEIWRPGARQVARLTHSRHAA
jgi:hypothetical protein